MMTPVRVMVILLKIDKEACLQTIEAATAVQTKMMMMTGYHSGLNA